MYPEKTMDDRMRAAISDWRSARADVVGPLSLAGLARHAGALADALGAIAAADSARLGRPVSCGRGCAACCREAVPISAGEALLLGETIADSAWDRRAEIEEGFRRAGAALREAGMENSPLLDRAAGYFALSIPCPFLADEECSVHVTRPMACRGHLVTSPPAACRDFPDTGIHVVGPPISVGEALSELTGAWLGGKEFIPLPRLWDWLAGAEEVARRTWDGAEALDGLAEACLTRLG
jgi:Fe-S-cluster containining protein